MQPISAPVKDASEVVDTVQTQVTNPFPVGNEWVRADFHLHTRADKEFLKDDEWDELGKEGLFASQYVAQLEVQNIRLGVITNHNKFDYSEFKQLKNQAKKKGIFLMPGVELSVIEGRGGLHCLIVFDESKWLGQLDYINELLTFAFEGIANRENENTTCSWVTSKLLEKLDTHRKAGRDSFIVMAHVEQKSGFYEEISGGRIKVLGADPKFRANVLGFQKVRTHDKIKNLKLWLNNALPSFVEGSDCKSIAQVGQAHIQGELEKRTYIKLGAFSFEAVKSALIDGDKRIATEVPIHSQPYLSKVEFVGGDLNGIALNLSPEMNNFIGIRGSGKSTLIETIRYGLGMELEDDSDTEYKSGLVKKMLDAGGKIILYVKDLPNSRAYRIERIYGERVEVYNDITQERLPDFSVAKDIFRVIYFGQKDLTGIGSDGFSRSLIDKFFGHILAPIRREVLDSENKVKAYLGELSLLNSALEQEPQLQETRNSIKHQLQVFKDQKIDEKLAKEVNFNKDIAHVKTFALEVNGVSNKLKEIVSSYSALPSKFGAYKSTDNLQIALKANEISDLIKHRIEGIQREAEELSSHSVVLVGLQNQLSELYTGLKEEFAEIKRTLSTNTLDSGLYVKLVSSLDDIERKLGILSEKNNSRVDLNRKLNEELAILNRLWYKEYTAINTSVSVLNARQLPVKIKVLFKEDRKAFFDFLKNHLRGTGITTAHINRIVESYKDAHLIYADLENEKSKLHQILSGGGLLNRFKETFYKYMVSFLTYRVSDICTLEYQGVELKRLSLGQRASAMILFLLAVDGFAQFIIDQPEDDLDNQSIYHDVVKELIRLKYKCQFLFATHNPNIPVLGDCEQVFSCNHKNGHIISPRSGGIDSQEIRKEIISVMEGGEDAFRRRNEIYSLWQN